MSTHMYRAPLVWMRLQSRSSALFSRSSHLQLCTYSLPHALTALHLHKPCRRPFRHPRSVSECEYECERMSDQMAPLPHTHTPRCTECCACHDFGNGISTPRCTPPAARAPTSCPFRQPQISAPATQTHTQMHRMLRLPRLRQWHLQSAAPATISHAPRRARDNILSR